MWSITLTHKGNGGRRGNDQVGGKRRLRQVNNHDLPSHATGTQQLIETEENRVGKKDSANRSRKRGNRAHGRK